MRSRHDWGDTSICWHPFHFNIEGALWLAVAVGVANKINPSSRMVETDSDSRQNTRPDFVAHRFQVIADAIEPAAGVGNLFAKDHSRRD